MKTINRFECGRGEYLRCLSLTALYQVSGLGWEMRLRGAFRNAGGGVCRMASKSVGAEMCVYEELEEIAREPIGGETGPYVCLFLAKSTHLRLSSNSQVARSINGQLLPGDSSEERVHSIRMEPHNMGQLYSVRKAQPLV